MTWVRIDDDFGEHPKVAALDDHALALFVTGLAYCNRNLTDGFIPSRIGQGQLRYSEGNTQPAIRQLEEVGLWEPIVGGWRVHDFTDYQPTKQQVEEERSKKQAAGRAGGLARGLARAKAPAQADRVAPAQAESKPVPVPVPVPKAVPQDLQAKTAAAVAAPSENGFPPDWAYLLGKLHEAGWADHGKGALTWGSIHKFSTEFGERVVDGALRTLQIEPPSPLGAHPYFGATCARIAAEGAA